jgi:hypothetical protein
VLSLVDPPQPQGVHGLLQDAICCTSPWLYSFTSSLVSVQLDEPVRSQSPPLCRSFAIYGGRQFMPLRVAFIIEAIFRPRRSRSIVYVRLYGLDVAYDFVFAARRSFNRLE